MVALNFYLCVMAVACCVTSVWSDQGPNNRPIIGVLSQEATGQCLNARKKSYIGEPYVKYVESAGARVVPIKLKQSDEYYKSMFHQLNGLLMPGGLVSITKSLYSEVAGKFYNMARNSTDNGDPFPIWGTCLGFQTLATKFSSGEVISNCEDQDIAKPLHFAKGYKQSRLFGGMSADMEEILSTENVTVNYHQQGITPQDFHKHGLEKYLRILSTNIDTTGKEYISSYEGITYPFYGVQFHPEKNIFQWAKDKMRQNVPHSYHAVLAGQYFINFFVDQARKSHHKFNKDEIEVDLIYNYKAIKRAGIPNTIMDQVYCFDY